ncbi:hypothetical protein ACFU7D_19505 [Nocardioides sp. NPDC057577]|uniref:hypothetical protein n=1 Tax=Nocardioides sp. NPDC057577 TaxID=3346171 RepID=UPI00366D0246
MNADWESAVKIASPAIALVALFVSVLTLWSAARWRARPYLQFKVKSSNGGAARHQEDQWLNEGVAARHSAVVVVNWEDFEVSESDEGDQQDPQSQGPQDAKAQATVANDLFGFEVHVHNQGSAPAYGFELHVDCPYERSASRRLTGDFVAIGPTTLTEGGDPISVVLSADRGYGAKFVGQARWEGMNVFGLGWQHRTERLEFGRDVRVWMTWREAPRMKRIRRRALGKLHHGDWRH